MRSSSARSCAARAWSGCSRQRLEVAARLGEAPGVDRRRHQLPPGLEVVVARAPVPDAQAQRLVVHARVAQDRQRLGQGPPAAVAVGGDAEPAQGGLAVVVERQPPQLDAAGARPGGSAPAPPPAPTPRCRAASAPRRPRAARPPHGGGRWLVVGVGRRRARSRVSKAASGALTQRPRHRCVADAAGAADRLAAAAGPPSGRVVACRRPPCLRHRSSSPMRPLPCSRRRPTDPSGATVPAPRGAAGPGGATPAHPAHGRLRGGPQAGPPGRVRPTSARA